ncbi:MAG: transposase [Burkholderiales bacterium]|nr:transposase [Burkholderiales bacterium]
MARLSRLVVPGQAHHLVQRGHNGQPVFLDEQDRRLYLEALRDALRSQGVVLHAYALQDQQVQLLLRPPSEAALSRMMQALGRRYVAGFNRRHGRSGTLWDGRFRAGVVQGGTPLLQCLRLIDGLPGADRWGSAPHRLGRQRDPLVTDPTEFWQLGNTPFEREAAYGALLAQGLSAAEAARLEHAAANGWAHGDAAFQAQMAEAAGRPVRPRPRGRPPRAAPA